MTKLNDGICLALKKDAYFFYSLSEGRREIREKGRYHIDLLNVDLPDENSINFC